MAKNLSKDCILCQFGRQVSQQVFMANATQQMLALLYILKHLMLFFLLSNYITDIFNLK